MADSKASRRRRSSSILQVYHEPPEPLEQLNDQSALPNGNATWVNAKGAVRPAGAGPPSRPWEEPPADVVLAGAWAVHVVLIILLKIIYDIVPGMSQETSWTLTNISYMLGSYIMFHWVRGVPFEFNGGAYDNLNMWEQIDDGAQYTPAKKFLLSVPIVLFLLSTHYTHYDLMYFTINFLAVLGVVIPKLPYVRRPSPTRPAPRRDAASLTRRRHHRATGCGSASSQASRRTSRTRPTPAAGCIWVIAHRRWGNVTLGKDLGLCKKAYTPAGSMQLSSSGARPGPPRTWESDAPAFCHFIHEETMRSNAKRPGDDRVVRARISRSRANSDGLPHRMTWLTRRFPVLVRSRRTWLRVSVGG